MRSKVCEHAECKSLSPVFDYPGGKGRFCGVHKLEGMLNVKSKKCRHPGCTSVSPSFDMPGGSGRFCNVHKTSEMVIATLFCWFFIISVLTLFYLLP